MSLQVILTVCPEMANPRLQALAEMLSQDGLVDVVQLPNLDLLESSLQEHLPDMVLIDLATWDAEDMDRVQHICSHIQQTQFADYRPVIVLLSEGETVNQRIEYFVLGADDILDGRLDDDELRVRLLAHLRRNLDLLSHRLSRLPGLGVLSRILQRKLNQKFDWSLLKVKLVHYNAYQEHYGEVPARQVVQQVARLTASILVPPDWVGQAADDSFMLLTQPEKAEKLASILCRRFDELLPSLYSEEDRERGYMIGVEGNLSRRVPFMHLAVGIAHSQVAAGNEVKGILAHAEQLAYLASYSVKSHWVSDRHRLAVSPTPSPNGNGKQPEALIDTLPCVQAATKQRPRILIVESDAALAFLLQTTLELQGYEASCVSHPEEALTELEHFKPWLVVSDSLLNGAPLGWQLCRDIKARSPECQVLFTSTLHEREAALAAGADLYLPKPFDLIPLLTWIQKTVAEISIRRCI